MGPRLQHRRPADPDADGKGRRPLRQTLHGAEKLNHTRLPVRYFRLLRVAGLVLSGLLTTLLVSPWASDALRLRLRQRWSRTLLDILNIELDAELTHALPGSLLVANHISFVDIFALNAARPVAFVSKSEVRDWPIIGRLAAANETVFLRRGSRGHARIINQEIAALLEQGKHVTVFPEGTTTDGTHLLHFHAALLQPALNAGRPIVPLAISYWEPNGQRSLAPRYDGDISIAQCLLAVASQKKLIARLSTSPALGQNGQHRREIALTARATIAEAISRAPRQLAHIRASAREGSAPNSEGQAASAQVQQK